MVVLGSCRECLIYALAHGHGLGAQSCCHGKAGRLSLLDRALGDLRFFSVAVGHFPRALRRLDQCSRFCGRSRARLVYSDFSRLGGWRFALALCHARPSGREPGVVCGDLARVSVNGEQSGVHRGDGGCAAGNFVSSGHGCVLAWQVFRRPALFQCGFCAVNGTRDAIHDSGALVPVARGCRGSLAP